MFDNLTNPVLLWSAGKDSTLILAMLREQDIPVDIVQFGREMWTREQKQRADALIRKWNLKVFSYPPARISFFGEGEQISLVREYAFMGVPMPLISDVIDGDRCIAELNGHKAFAPPYTWRTVIVGSRKDDTHYSFPENVVPSERWTVGETDFYAPLFNWTRDEVKAELAKRGLDTSEVIDIADSGNISLCHLCLDTTKETVFCPKENSLIPTVQWNASENLAAFRAAYA